MITTNPEYAYSAYTRFKVGDFVRFGGPYETNKWSVHIGSSPRNKLIGIVVGIGNTLRWENARHYSSDERKYGLQRVSVRWLNGTDGEYQGIEGWFNVSLIPYKPNKK